ncbi:HET-domain-containing protein [Plenodomus tracheiphilus IPT5]|uniref:HET-domain-containing protein n=1 Tax=Plenodomus tracheiphilus IPT5 TaxID=1408161 RepID=A0A6A7AYX4_9PLEO|nr:HET-domain-containing protein [Plenodomus tracheiphilus IPT5]
MNAFFGNPVQWITRSSSSSQLNNELTEAVKRSNVCARCVAFSSTMLQNTSGDSQLLHLSEKMQQPMTATCPICQFFAAGVPEQYRWGPNSAGLWSIWHTHNARDGGRGKHIPWFDTSIDGCVTIECALKEEHERYSVHDVHYAVDCSRSCRSVEADTRQRYPEVVDFNLVKSWLNECKLTHSQCASTLTTPISGLKVIDCVSRTIVLAPEDCLFVALSYVWGMSSQHPTSNTFSITDIPLPQTIEDSIEATQSLGYRYLWIDRYCVPQHDAHIKDVQLQQMDAIYASAQVTLIAAAGNDPAYGLPGVSNKRTIAFQTLGPITFRRVPPFCDKMVDDSVWNTRAWTYQEEILSRRKLYFTDHCIWLGCNKAQNHRDPAQGFFGVWHPPRTMTMNLTFPTYSNHGGTIAMIAKFQDLVKHYSKRKLSFESDALNAFTGILNAFKARSTAMDIVWGIPLTKHILHPSKTLFWMNWRSTDPRQRRPEFPSWSWLGWRGATEFLPVPLCFTIPEGATKGSHGENDLLYNADAHIDHDQDIPLQEQTRSLKINGVTRQFPIAEVKWDDDTTWVLDGPHIILPLTNDSDAYFRIFWDTRDTGVLTATSLLGVAIVTEEQGPFWEELMVILLRPLGKCYERVGLACSDDGGQAGRYRECAQDGGVLHLQPLRSFKDYTKTPAKDISWLHPSKRKTVCIH